ncbi:hypothetical protein EC957_000703 [Mortierella hygrophila]|uniref:Uncharacterized protein n=1 Tax=Mortierella hygrophila TaxID=979708 RepID=A0A9P6FGG5_9FUNG|nr:hypothetical protein EC957_000703 [Mortierella hygrophila]
MALTDCDNQSMITEEDNTIDCDDDASEPGYPLVEKMNPSEYEEKPAASFWAFAESDEDDPFPDDNHDSALPLPSLLAAEDSSQGENFLLWRYIHPAPAKPLSDVSPVNLPLHATAVVSTSGPSRVSLLKQLPIDDFLFKRDKEDQRPQTASFTQPSSPQHQNAIFSDGSSKMKITNHGRPGQAKEFVSEADALDDDLIHSLVITNNVPIAKKASIKKQRR